MANFGVYFLRNVMEITFDHCENGPASKLRLIENLWQTQPLDLAEVPTTAQVIWKKNPAYLYYTTACTVVQKQHQRFSYWYSLLKFPQVIPRK